MRISHRWLSELVEISDVSVEELSERLSLTGLEVEEVIDLGAELDGVVVAEVLSKSAHPSADRLSVCEVHDGAKVHQVVCGAPNVEAGVLVPFAPVGTTLAGGMQIAEAKIRGVESFGMLCSEKELGLGNDQSGLMLLNPADDITRGQPLKVALKRDDVVLDLGVTPNRPDALSHVGVAREVAAMLGARSRIQSPTCAERGGPIDTFVHVKIEDNAGCKRYGARVIEEVKIGPSPAWVVARLAACGVRSVNNVVDVTNLVMMERGLPLHAFDLDRIAKDRDRAQIIVRAAREGEVLKTLDDSERELEPGDVVVADANGAIALGGVMGGASTEVTEKTTRVLLEAAYFEPSRVRRTARRLDLHSESSHRFERGCDPNGVRQALDRAASLIAELSGGVVARGIADVYPTRIEPCTISLRPASSSPSAGKIDDVAASSTVFCGSPIKRAARAGRSEMVQGSIRVG